MFPNSFPETATPTSPLTEKFQVLYELLSEFALDATQLHANLMVRDDATRAIFSSLARITGFSDQLAMVLALMKEDVRVVEELSTSPLSMDWTGAVEDSFYQWVRSQRPTAAPMN